MNEETFSNCCGAVMTSVDVIQERCPKCGEHCTPESPEREEPLNDETTIKQ